MHLTNESRIFFIFFLSIFLSFQMKLIVNSFMKNAQLQRISFSPSYLIDRIQPSRHTTTTSKSSSISSSCSSGSSNNNLIRIIQTQRRIPKPLGSQRCAEFAKMYQENPPQIPSILKYLSNTMIALVFIPIMRFFNHFTIHRKEILYEAVFHRPKERGLLSFSNHQSMLDDPGLWTVILPFWRMRPSQLRWQLCTENMFFLKEWLTWIFHAGHVLPIDREGSRDQPIFEVYCQKIIEGKWCHIFPEGRIWQNWRFSDPTIPRLGPLKTGIGKLILRSYPNDPIVLPMYHRGMDAVYPENVLPLEAGDQPSTPRHKLPRVGNQIKVYIGQPISFREKIKQFKEQNPDIIWNDWKTNPKELAFQREITAEIEQHLLVLENEAYQRNCL